MSLRQGSGYSRTYPVNVGPRSNRGRARRYNAYQCRLTQSKATGTVCPTKTREIRSVTTGALLKFIVDEILDARKGTGRNFLKSVVEIRGTVTGRHTD